MKRIAVIPGDGIGIDVTREAVRVLETIGAVGGTKLELVHFDWGAEKYLATGNSLPEDGLVTMRGFDAVLLGALGDPRVPDLRHARDILFGHALRARPVRQHPAGQAARRSARARCKDRSAQGHRLRRVPREHRGHLRRHGRQFKRGTPDEIAINEDVNTRKGVERIIRAAFEYASARRKRSVHMADKSNAMTHAHELWHRVLLRGRRGVPGDRGASTSTSTRSCLLPRAGPAQFEVIVTNNLFGDIVTDLGAALQGGLGMAASANVHPGARRMFEPVHGSAPPPPARTSRTRSPRSSPRA